MQTGWLRLEGYAGVVKQLVEVVGSTRLRYRIRAITRTKIAGRNKWLMPGAVALVPRGAVVGILEQKER